MIKFIRIILIVLFCLALAGAANLYVYNYTHEDTTPPVFRSDSDLIELSVSDPRESLLKDLYASDNVDGDVTAKIHIKEISTLINETDVTVSYIVFDEASNYATYTRTARYTDYDSPRFSMNRPMIFNVGEAVNFRDSITVTDQRDGNISGRLRLEESTVINSTPGTYSVRLSATNRMGDTVELPLTVQIIDNSVSRPVITLRKNLIYLDHNARPLFNRYLKKVVDPLADPEQPIPLSDVKVNSSGVDYSVPGVYEVYYYYTGISGEIATAILTVIIL